MSDHIDTRDGWRLWTGETEVTRPLLRLENEDGSTLYWVREEPPPPLPTEDCTVIEVEWKTGTHPAVVFTLDAGNGIWYNRRFEHETVTLQGLIRGFTVRSSPRVQAEDDDEWYDREDLAKAVADERDRAYGLIQAELLKDPYADWTARGSKKQRHYGKGFVSGRTDALNIVHRHLFPKP